MRLRKIKNYILADYDETIADNNTVMLIADNTDNTWQEDRESEETEDNTLQGKIAEDIFAGYISSYLSEKVAIKSYDDIRNDNFKKHAPFDFLIWKEGEVDITPIEQSIQADISAATDRFVRLSDYSRRLCKEANVKIAEVKSTRIRDNLKSDACFDNDYSNDNSVERLANTIRNTDDIFCYPAYKRSDENEKYAMEDYCEYVKARESSLQTYEGEELKHRVIDIECEKQCCDLFIRVYEDPDNKKGIITGWLTKERLLDYSVRLKKMRKKNKSERALYLAKRLTNTMGIGCLPILFEKNECVYASPYTSSNFYHSTRECKFLKSVPAEEIVVYEDEDKAICEGIYTARCKECF